MESTEALDQEHAIEKCRTWKFKLGPFHININPVVTLISAVIIWGFVVFCLVWTDIAADRMPKWKLWVTDTWTWLYIGTQDIWAVFVLVLYFSKYSDIKLGGQHEKPEYNDASYFTMLFAAGIGVGLFYFGVAEPVYHYAPGEYGNRYWGRYNDNQRAQDAMTLTIFHWGVHAWIVYTLVGMLLGLLAYRRNLPMTMRTCFYPLLGDKVFGTLGDIIDILSVVCTMFGVCTSLGLGVIQLNTGLSRMNPSIAMSKENQVIIIWCITAVATVSVVSGVKLGIRRLSELCFSLGMFLWLVVFFYDDTWYLLNVFTQTTGAYMQWIVQLGFHTDAFVQLGNAPDKKENVAWMNDWTLFYWGWWIAWSPFVGIFIAKISRGRTIKEFIIYTLTIPIVYSIMWFSVFGGAGLRMERNAENANITCSSVLGGKNSTESFHGLYRLSCRATTSMWFDLLEQYGGLGRFMSGMSLAGLVLYFVTSSDSGSLVIDSLSANGHPDPPVLQRIFWAFTEGATATALLWSGGQEALKALQAASICSGLFYTVILNFVVVAMWRFLKMEAGDMDRNAPQFFFGILDIFYRPSRRRICNLFVAILAPWYPMGDAAAKLNKGNRCIYMLVLAIPFYGWLILEALQGLEVGLAYIGWAVLFGFIAYGTGIRFQMREEFGIVGNMAEDFFAVMLLYPLAALQMQEQMLYGEINSKEFEKDAEIGDENFTMAPMMSEKGKEAENGLHQRAPLDNNHSIHVVTAM